MVFKLKITYASRVIEIPIRIRNEEKVLIKGLKGYDEYMKRVKYRLIPYLW